MSSAVKRFFIASFGYVWYFSRNHEPAETIHVAVIVCQTHTLRQVSYGVKRLIVSFAALSVYIRGNDGVWRTMS